MYQDIKELKFFKIELEKENIMGLGHWIAIGLSILCVITLIVHGFVMKKIDKSE